MKVKTITGFIMALLMIGSIGCNKEEGVNCFTNNGPIVKETRSVGSFREIEMHDNVSVFFTQDTLKTEVIVETGQNILSGISTTVDSGRLVIRNNNICNWIRSFEVPINVYVTVGALDSLEYRSAGDLIFENALKQDSVQFDIWEGAGSINIKLDTRKSRIYIHQGTADLTITGFSQVNQVSSQGFGPVDMLGLNTIYTYISSSSPNNCYLQTDYELFATIYNIGDIYYTGNPSNVGSEVFSTGKLIKIE